MTGDQSDILGAIWMEKETILIDQSLDPEDNPLSLGRYRFSIGHEIGHWRLHRSYVANDSKQASLFDAVPEPTIICRSSQAKERVEWQADYFASCLLMPKALVVDAWREQFGNVNPRVLRRKNRIKLPSDAHDEFAVAIRSAQRQLDHDALETFMRPLPLAKRSEVSPIAMQIRLEKLGLLHRETPRPRSLAIVS